MPRGFVFLIIEPVRAILTLLLLPTKPYLSWSLSLLQPRSSSQAQMVISPLGFLTDKFAHHGDRFELVVVEDITKDGAFDEAVKGVDAIAHTASPFHYNSDNPDGMSSTFGYLVFIDDHDISI